VRQDFVDYVVGRKGIELSGERLCDH